jgi:hypothetical protein
MQKYFSLSFHIKDFICPFYLFKGNLQWRKYSIFWPTKRATRRASNVVLINIFSFMWESTWTWGNFLGDLNKISQSAQNFQPPWKHFLRFSTNCLNFLARLENLWTFFHVARDFGQQWNLFLTSIIYPKLSTWIFKIPKLPNCFLFGDNQDFSKVPNIFGSKIEFF